MNPRLRKLAADWKTYVALMAAAGTAMSTLSATVSGVADTVKVFKNLPPEALWALAAVFLVIAIVALASALSRHSFLREPQRFLLSPENPQHLVGREEEVEKLARQCVRHAVVFLTGDSGSGKSALVRAGLAPALLSEDSPGGQELVPLVVDLSGVGWERGLSLAVARGLGRLPEDAWLALGGGDRPAVESLFLWLGNRPPHSPRRLLIVFDQFDDYLAAHRQHFYDGTTLRRSTDLEERSPDWHGLADRLRGGAVSLLVVARSEASASLPALGFVEDARIAREHLTRLPGNLVAPLLSRLAEPLEEGRPVVEDPELGWLQLRSRLLRDLEASGEGQILPIQLSVALNSLRLLRYLTTAEYEQIGGLRGLERLHVERHAKTAAEVSGAPTGAVLEALLTMVSSDGSKTRPAARGDFEGVLGRHGGTSEAAEKAIRQLEDDKLLRRVGGEAEEPETLLLYHDYLARGVREAYRQANRWTELLRERAQIYQESVSWRQRWRALLSPSEQTRLLWEHRRRGFSFSDRRRFFGLSTVKWAPIVLALLLVGVGGWAADRYRNYEIAAEVMKAIGHDDWVTKEEAQELLRLGTAGRIAGVEALRLAAQDGQTAARASKRVASLVSIVIGLDPAGERSSALAQGLVVSTLENDQADSASTTFVTDVASELHLNSSTAKQISGSTVSRMKTETDADALVSLVSALGSLSAKLERQDVVPLAEVLVSRMKTETNALVLINLVSALGSLSTKLERQDAVPLAEVLVSRMKTETNAFVLGNLGSTLGSLSAKLGRKNVAPGAEVLVSRMKTETGVALASLGSAFGSLSPKLERQDVVPGAEVLVSRMKSETDFVLARLVSALGSLSGKLEREDVAPLAEVLVSRMKTETDAFVLARLGSALGSLSAKLKREDAAPLAEVLVSQMKTETDTFVLASLSSALGSLSSKLKREDAVPGAEVLVSRMKTETDADALARLGLALGSLSPKLEREDAVPGAEVLVSRMKTETDADALARLGLALGSLSPKLERQDAVPGAEVLVTRMKTETGADALVSLGSALGSLSAKLERQDVAPLAEVLVSRMQTETDALALARLGSTLGSLSAKLEGQDLAPAFDLLVMRAYSEWDRETLASLMRAVIALGPILPNPVSLRAAYPQPVRVEQVYVDLLKSPFVVRDARRALLKGLEKTTGQSFSGDLWNFVDWATKTPEGRALGLDLDGRYPQKVWE